MIGKKRTGIIAVMMSLSLILSASSTAFAKDSEKIDISPDKETRVVNVTLKESSWYGKSMSVVCYAPGYDSSASVAKNSKYVVYLSQKKAAGNFKFKINNKPESGKYTVVLGCSKSKIEKSFEFKSETSAPSTKPDDSKPDSGDSGNNNSGSSQAAASVTKPGKPKIKVKAGKKKIKVTWKKVKKAKGYKVYISNKKKSGFKLKKTLKGAKKTSFVIKKLKSKKVYYVKVAAYTTSGCSTVVGKKSAAAKAKVK
ncbi:fibronectin type III domain-containing protein [Eubacterium xylanophilum]|uniref:fibronectin type III domain-containing protein n=1 Tax=Eubacterium xylanophilum TaxID=39497 RepID=UPI00047B1EEC|nr:fibronectin type III domain-containing protein [Eubacterium xylanophilum]